MKPFRSLLRQAVLALLTLFFFGATPALAAECPKLNFFKFESTSTVCGSDYHMGVLGCVPNPASKDAKSTTPSDDPNKSAVYVYLVGVNNLIMPYIFFGALIYVVFSGIEYMLAGYGGGNEKKAKQQIGGITVGIIFYFLMVTIANWFACNVATIK